MFPKRRRCMALLQCPIGCTDPVENYSARILVPGHLFERPPQSKQGTARHSCREEQLVNRMAACTLEIHIRSGAGRCEPAEVFP
jgi:hypothetical protein